jgi:hypothetical protein
MFRKYEGMTHKIITKGVCTYQKINAISFSVTVNNWSKLLRRDLLTNDDSVVTPFRPNWFRMCFCSDPLKV